MFRFDEHDIDYFRSLIVQGNELYDFSDSQTKEIYDSLLDSTQAMAISRDTTSFSEIEDCVTKAISENKGDGLVLLSGAYPHMIGAILNLAKQYNVIYVPIGEKISTHTLDYPSKTETVSQNDLRIQIKRDIGVTRYLNFNDMEQLRACLDSGKIDPNKQTIIILAAHETGLHHIHAAFYNHSQYSFEIFKKLTAFVLEKNNKPFVCFVNEDLHINYAMKDLTSKNPAQVPKFEFLREAYQKGCPVKIGAFGHLDRQRQSQTFFGLSSLQQRYPELKETRKVLQKENLGQLAEFFCKFTH